MKMDLTEFPEHLRESLAGLVSTMESMHKENPDILVKFVRLLLKHFDTSQMFRDGDAQTEELEFVADENNHPPDDSSVAGVTGISHEEGEPEQVWDLKSLAEDVRSVAEQTLSQSSFVFDSRSGMYYNHEQQCYYVPDYKLYYYVQNKAYYSYDEENNCMKFYSSTDAPQYNDSSGGTGESVEKEVTTVSNPVSSPGASVSKSPLFPIASMTIEPKKPLRAIDDEIEEGEIVDDDEEYLSNPPSPQQAYSSTPLVISASPTRIDLNVEPEDHCAPCVRLTVRECGNGLEIGQLFIITRSGGTLGREGKHDIIIPDTNVSKDHLTFHYTYREGMDVYEIVDCSKNGTYLDGSSMVQNRVYQLQHGSVLRVGGTSLLCHIHDGTGTCYECEPGCLGFMNPVSPPPLPSGSSLKTRHALEMAQIKRKFGLNKHKTPMLPKGYEDKSKIRRETVGSSHDSEKTDATSTEAPLSSGNKGYEMLTKMGWKEGKAVGKSGEGTTSPVNVTLKFSKRGLGCLEDDYIPPVKPKSKTKNLEITKKRYETFRSENLHETDYLGREYELIKGKIRSGTALRCIFKDGIPSFSSVCDSCTFRLFEKRPEYAKKFTGSDRNCPLIHQNEFIPHMRSVVIPLTKIIKKLDDDKELNGVMDYMAKHHGSWTTKQEMEDMGQSIKKTLKMLNKYKVTSDFEGAFDKFWTNFVQNYVERLEKLKTDETQSKK